MLTDLQVQARPCDGCDLSRGETWRAVPDHEDMYEVSDRGGVKSLARLNRAGHRIKLRYLSGTIDSHGYRSVKLVWFGEEKSFRLHQLVALAFHGPRPDGAETRHLDGNNLHNCASNLAYGVHAENMEDSILHGTHISLRDSSGENNPTAKLTQAQVAEIRARYAGGGIRQQDLADEYGVSQVKISQVVTGNGWKGVSGPLRKATRVRSKLTESQVREIRARYAAGGVTQRALADEYGVSLSAVENLASGRTWKDVA